MKRAVAALGTLLFLMSLSGISGSEVLESGRFFFQIDEDVGVEGFQFAKVADGNLELTSEFQALSEQLVVDFGTDRLFSQEVVVTPELELISYQLRSDTERGTIEVGVQVKDAVATIRWKAQAPGEEPQKRERQVILEDNVITTGIAASQFFLLQKYVNEQLDLEGNLSITLMALDPTDIDEPFVELTLERLRPVVLEDAATKRQFRAQRVEVRQEEFRAELLACATTEPEGICTETGRFLGFVSGTASLAGVHLKDAPAGGAEVTSVAAGSFAAQAGLQEGDIIVAVNGRAVDDARELRELIRFQNPSQPVTLTLLRNGQELELEVRLSGSSLTVFRFDLFEAGFALVGEASQ